MEVTSAREGLATMGAGATIMATTLCLHLCHQDRAAVSDQSTSLRYLEDRALSENCVQAVPGTTAQLSATWLDLGNGQLLLS